jgi:hypothetical protein
MLPIMGETKPLNNRQAVEIIARRCPSGKWATDEVFVVSRDERSLTWITILSPEGTNHLILSFALECNAEWAKSFRGRLRLRKYRRLAFPILISIDEGKHNLRIWQHIIRTGLEDFDPSEHIKEFEELGALIQADSYLR